MISSKSFPSLGQFIEDSVGKTASTTPARYTFSDPNYNSNLLPEESYATTTISLPLGTIPVQISNNPTKRQLGLSYRESLKEGKGMLFIFPEPGKYGFWMKDMNFSIDIVWVHKDRKVAGVIQNVSPDTFPENFYPPTEIQFVLELNAGESGKFGIATNTILKF